MAVELILLKSPGSILDSGVANSRGGTSPFECIKDRSSLQMAGTANKAQPQYSSYQGQSNFLSH